MAIQTDVEDIQRRCRAAAERFESLAGPARVEVRVSADLLLEAASLLRGYHQSLLLTELDRQKRGGVGVFNPKFADSAKELAKDIDFAIDVTEPREVLLARFEEIIKARTVPMRNTLSAVLHQLEQGEASDILAGEVTRPDAVRDLCWCRDQIRESLKLIS